jgi:hypothetical protein
MVIGAVMVSNVFTGLYTESWNGWVWFAVALGPVLIWVYTVSSDASAVTDVTDDRWSAGHLFRHSPCYFCYVSHSQCYLDNINAQTDRVDPYFQQCVRKRVSGLARSILSEQQLMALFISHYIFRSALFWFGWILVFVLALAPQYIGRFMRRTYAPNDINIINNIK